MAEKAKKSNSLATVIVAVVMFGGMVSFVYVRYLWKPFGERIETAQKKIEQIDADITKARVLSKKIEQLNAVLASLRAKEAEAESRLPHGKQLPNLVRGITQLARQSGVSVSRITPMQTSKMPFYSQTAYGLNGTGTFYDVYKFISQLAVSERIYTIENLRISAGSDKTVNVSFTLMSYDYDS
ncbi:MAG: type 4a pilus biogenesis protein PilO [Elusimicrobia bacterium]|nr:type 4a pilus biogenesis protein PilO [Elusimicrobiota bacterium]